MGRMSDIRSANNERRWEYAYRDRRYDEVAPDPGVVHGRLVQGADLNLLIVPGKSRTGTGPDPETVTTVLTFDAEFMRVYSALPKRDPMTKRGRR